MATHSRTLAWKIPWMEAPAHGVVKSWTPLSDFTFTFHFHALEKEMATHSSVLAGRITGTQLKRLSSSPEMCPQNISSLEHQHDCVWDQLSWDICGLNYIDLVLFYFYNVYYAKCAQFISKMKTKLKCFPVKTDGETLIGVYLGISTLYNVSSPWQELNSQIMMQVSLLILLKSNYVDDLPHCRS